MLALRDGSGGGSVWREPFERVVAVLATLDTEGVLVAGFGLSAKDLVRCLGSALGGRGGSSHSPQAGAFIRDPFSSDLVRVAVTRGPSYAVATGDGTTALVRLSWVLFRVGNGGGCFRAGRGGGPLGRLDMGGCADVLMAFSLGMLNDFCFITGRLSGT